jgi:hypothetical protein
VCNVINQNSCGSGSICGITESGNSLIMTNAHVAGTTIGRRVKVWVESQNDTIWCRVVRAAYSNNVIADWALLESEQPYAKVDPVFLTKFGPTGSHYTKGFPRCRQHNGTDITTHRIMASGVWLWLPDAIGGQSGSGVWNDVTNLQQGLLTWSWTERGVQYGAGQTTSAIWNQNRSRQLVGFVKPEGLVELSQGERFDMSGLDTTDTDDPVVDEGYFEGPIKRAAGIQDYPIWFEDQVEPPTPPDDRPDAFTMTMWLGHLQRTIDYYTDERERFEQMNPPDGGNGGDSDNGNGSDPDNDPYDLG